MRSTAKLSSKTRGKKCLLKNDLKLFLKTWQPIIQYLANISFINDGKIKTFVDKSIWGYLLPRHIHQNEKLKKFFRQKENDPRWILIMHKDMNDVRKAKSSEEIFKKKSNFRSNTFQDIKISCEIKTLWYWHKVKRERSILTEKRFKNHTQTYAVTRFSTNMPV